MVPIAFPLITKEQVYGANWAHSISPYFSSCFLIMFLIKFFELLYLYRHISEKTIGKDLWKVDSLWRALRTGALSEITQNISSNSSSFSSTFTLPVSCHRTSEQCILSKEDGEKNAVLRGVMLQSSNNIFWFWGFFFVLHFTSFAAICVINYSFAVYLILESWGKMH